MPSIGDKATASAEKRVQDRLVKIYSKARKDMMEQMKEFNARFAQKDQEKRARVKSGQMTQEDYDKWKRMQVLQSDIWRQKVEQATKTLEDANRQALRVINGEKMDVFAENANYEAYRLSKETGIGYGFSVYDKDTVGKLIREQPELMPRKVVNGKKDRAWNRTKISNAVTQSIIQGDSLPEMTARIARETAHENDAAMARYAATAMTSAQNAGRMDTMERAKGMGIKVRKKWIATLDARTRDSHAELDGQVVDIDEPFVTHNRDGSLAEIMFPGDPQADGEQVWNCRCTLGYVYEEYPDEEDAERIAAEYYRDEDDNLRSRPAYVKSMSYSEWKKAMQIPARQKTTHEESELAEKIKDALEGNQGSTSKDTIRGGAIMREDRRVFGQLTSQNYETVSGDVVELKESYRQRQADGSFGDPVTEKSGEFIVPENNNSEAVMVYQMPKGAKQFMAYDETSNTIMSNGRIALRYNTGNNDARLNVTDIINNEIAVLGGIRKEGVWYRTTNNPKEIEYIKKGEIRASVNHMTGEQESGLSVWERPKYPAKFEYRISGELVGIGSDGEPLLDPKSVRLLEQIDIKEAEQKGRELFCKKYHWTEDQLEKALKGDYEIKRR